MKRLESRNYVATDIFDKIRDKYVVMPRLLRDFGSK